MSSSQSPSDLDFHVLNFFYDDENSCALTVLINNVRFHIIADSSNVRKGTPGQEYARLLQAVKESGIDEDFGESSDSGVDVSHGEKDGGEELASSQDSAGPEESLHRWMLAPLEALIDKLAPGVKAPEEQTLKDWYTSPTRFFNLETKNHKLQGIELEASADLEQRMRGLLHQIAIPRYIQQIDVPRFQAGELTVLEGSSLPAPYHPARVMTQDGAIYFLKLVDRDNPQPTKREIQILNRIAEKGLHTKTRCPKLEGLVHFDDERTKIMGFLQTDIPNPVPLTWKFDTKVNQDLRDRWAEEAERIKDVLHEHGVIWGDAKADNFMVDEHDELWIIDFGGSYTEGWVDEEIKETEEGDDMGVVKIVNALHDPVANTWDPDTAQSYGGSEKQHGTSSGSKKRKIDDDEVSEVAATKRRRQSSTEGEDSYCYCDMPGSGRMVACDGSECELEWFHFDCVGLSQALASDEKWYCEDCRPDE